MDVDYKIISKKKVLKKTIKKCVKNIQDNDFDNDSELQKELPPCKFCKSVPLSKSLSCKFCIN